MGKDIMLARTFFPRDWPGRFCDQSVWMIKTLNLRRSEMLSEIFKGKHIQAVNSRDGSLKLHIGNRVFLGVEKECTSCCRMKDISEFYRSAGGRYGVASWCKECFKLYRKIKRNRQEDVLP